jgi:FtsP/CotA-like multicopper oxidase with cupredoxin domain
MRVHRRRHRTPRVALRQTVSVATTIWVVVVLVAAVWSAAGGAQASPERITINDNRRPAGTFGRGTMTIRLEARVGEWRPDGEAGLGVLVKAFAVEGGPLQIPGPLIRVSEGTQMRVFIRNRLNGDSLVMHGLYERPGKASAGVAIPPDETREFTFLAGSPGLWMNLPDRGGVKSASNAAPGAIAFIVRCVSPDQSGTPS